MKDTTLSVYAGEKAGRPKKKKGQAVTPGRDT